MNNTIKNYLNNTHAILFAFIALYTLIILISASIPMFWDMEYISKISNHIYDNNFSSLIFSDTDSGATPLYSTYLAALWVLFGKSLFVNHIAILPFVTGILFQYYKLANRFLDKKYVVFSFIILLLEPTITSQTILAGYDLVFCFLFLFGLNSVFDNNRYKIALSVIAMPLLNSRGFSLVCSIFLIDFYINTAGYSNIKKFLKSIAAYLPSIIILIIWLLYHYMSTGWFIVSGSRERFHHINGLEEILRNLIYIAWNIIDFGRVVIYFVIFILAYKVIKSNKSTSKKHINSASLRGFYRSNPIIAILVRLLHFVRNDDEFFRDDCKSKNKKGINLFIIMLFSFIPYLIFFLPFTYPVSHRHFMITYILGSLTFVYFLFILKRKTLRIIVFTVTGISLLSGNFWLYPEHFGNGWDSSLKVIPYFKLKNEFDSFIKKSDIAPSTIGAKFPMNFDDYDTFFKNKHFAYTDIDKMPLNKFNYVVQSNISNTFTPDEIATLNNKWIIVKELKSWQIYIKLFKNPYK